MHIRQACVRAAMAVPVSDRPEARRGRAASARFIRHLPALRRPRFVAGEESRVSHLSSRPANNDALLVFIPCAQRRRQSHRTIETSAAVGRRLSELTHSLLLCGMKSYRTYLPFVER